jgi:Domain of unknown function (DUF397)
VKRTLRNSKGKYMSGLNKITPAWRKSTWSGNGDCVEVIFNTDSVLVRDSKDPAGPVLSFTFSEWAAFLAGVRDGEFDIGESPASHGRRAAKIS